MLSLRSKKQKAKSKKQETRDKKQETTGQSKKQETRNNRPEQKAKSKKQETRERSLNFLGARCVITEKIQRPLPENNMKINQAKEYVEILRANGFPIWDGKGIKMAYVMVTSAKRKEVKNDMNCTDSDNPLLDENQRSKKQLTMIGDKK